jgi:hypothetical protein
VSKISTFTEIVIFDSKWLLAFYLNYSQEAFGRNFFTYLKFLGRILANFPHFEKNKSRLMRSPCCLCVCMCMPPIVAGQRLGKKIPAARNTHTTIELLAASFSMLSVSYQRKIGDSQNFLYMYYWPMEWKNLKQWLGKKIIANREYCGRKKQSLWHRTQWN